MAHTNCILLLGVIKTLLEPDIRLTQANTYSVLTLLTLLKLVGVGLYWINAKVAVLRLSLHY